MHWYYKIDLPVDICKLFVSRMFFAIRENENVRGLLMDLHVSRIAPAIGWSSTMGSSGKTFEGDDDVETGIAINTKYSLKTQALILAHEIGHLIFLLAADCESVRKKFRHFTVNSWIVEEEIVERFATKWVFQKEIYHQVITLLGELQNSGEILIYIPTGVPRRNMFFLAWD